MTYEFDPNTDRYTNDWLDSQDCECEGDDDCPECDPDYIGDADYGYDD